MAYFYHNAELVTNGSVLFGEFLIRKGADLTGKSYLIVGFQTRSGKGKTYAAFRNSTHALTFTEQAEIYDNGDPKPNFDTKLIKKCHVAFGDKPCNGIGGVYGQEYTPPTSTSYGLWKVWLWLPDSYQY